MENNRIIIALDGPAGAGKSTIAKHIAKKLNFLYIDTGAMYRAITYVVLERNICVSDENKINELLFQVEIDFKKNKNNQIDVYFNEKKINNELRTRRVDLNVSIVCKYPEVRKYMVKLQRRISEDYDVILDGRDIGTVVFPDTPHKFYLDASVDKRAKRRLKDKKNIEKLSFAEIKKDIIRRDKIDSSRKLSPLKQAGDAVYIDTTNMAINKVVDFILKKIELKSNKRGEIFHPQ